LSSRFSASGRIGSCPGCGGDWLSAPWPLRRELTERRKREIREGLPDALDLFIVCVEAGCGLDQAIVKASDELGLTYPALALQSSA
jgi:tight adherence protein C